MKSNRNHKAADLADGTWPNLTGKFKPHDDRHTHSTWLEAVRDAYGCRPDPRYHFSIRSMPTVNIQLPPARWSQWRAWHRTADPSRITR
jgi:integrase